MKYQWEQPNSPVEELRFSPKQKGQTEEAIILLRPQDKNNVAVDQQLIDQGFTVSYDIINDKPALRVNGFQQAQHVLDTLQTSDATAGIPKRSASAEAKATPLGQKIRENSLVLSAVFYQLGNLSTALSGWFRKDKDELRSGLSFAVGDTTMLLFGKRSDKEKHDSVMQGFGEALKKNGYLPEFGSPFSNGGAASEISTWQKIRNFMYDKVIVVKSISEMTAGYSLAKAGHQQKNNFKKAAGILVGSGFALGLSIPEKKPSQIRDELGVATPDEAAEALAEKSALTRLKYRIQKMPLLISGFFAGLNNISSILGAVDERKHYWQKHDIANQLGNAQDGANGKNVPMKDSITSDAGTKQKVKIRNETAYSKFNRLSYEAENASAGKAVLLADEVKVAKKELDDLKEKQNSVLKGRYPNSKLIKAKNFWKFNIAQGLFFLVANTLYGLSSKSGRSANEELLGKRFIAAAASEAMMSPPENRAEIVNMAAHYAGSLDELDFTATEVRTMLEKKIETLEQQHNMIAPAIVGQKRDVEIAQGDAAEHNTDNAPKQEKAPILEARPVEAEHKSDNETAVADIEEKSDAAKFAQKVGKTVDHLNPEQTEAEVPAGVTYH